VSEVQGWIRLEPQTRSESMQDSLQACIHDPLWLLARQWQSGEFQGEDAASPVRVKLSYEVNQFTHFLPAYPRQSNQPDLQSTQDIRNSIPIPLEVLVEREASTYQASREYQDCRRATETGLQFLRMLSAGSLSQNYRIQFLQEYQLEPVAALQERQLLDSDSLRFLDVFSGRVIDGLKLRQDFPVRSQLSAEIVLPAKAPFNSIDSISEDYSKIKTIVKLWLDWFDSLFSEFDPSPGKLTTPRSWNPSRVEYDFAVASPQDDKSEQMHLLTAPEYHGGHLDWHTFDLNYDAANDLKQETVWKNQLEQKLLDDTFQKKETSIVPTPVQFSGMPRPRWWEFEDNKVDFGSVEAAPEDLGRLVLVDFMLIYGNDFFLIPLNLDIGKLCYINELIVYDSFGYSTQVPSSSKASKSPLAAPWRMFTLTGSFAEQPVPDVLLMPSVLGQSYESKPLEEVLFLRDEMANLAWAVERTITSFSGKPLSRFESYQQKLQQQKQQAPATAVQTTGRLSYRLMDGPPEYWIPLLPYRVNNEASIELRLSQFLDLSEGRSDHSPKGHILSEISNLCEEEVPRAGACVRRTYQYARWIDGSTYVWIGRRKQSGRGEGSSGLKFDFVTNA
jgi:hypothetical protein